MARYLLMHFPLFLVDDMPFTVERALRCGACGLLDSVLPSLSLFVNDLH